MSNGSDDPIAEAAALRVGHKTPPATSRFVKGQSGNPRGRPRGRHREAPYEAVLGQMVTIRDGGVERRVRADEAFLLHLAKRGLEGDGQAGRATMAALEDAKRSRGLEVETLTFVIQYASSGSVNDALEPLRMGRVLDPCRPTARVRLEPWIVEVALARLGDRRLSCEEQAKVVGATRTPCTVRWPDWWEVPCTEGVATPPTPRGDV